MASRTLRRRAPHGKADGKSDNPCETSSLGSLKEPLRGDFDDKDTDSEGQIVLDLWKSDKRKQHLHWMILLTQLATQWAQWLVSIVVGSASLIRRLLPAASFCQDGSGKTLVSATLSTVQEARLRNLQRRLQVAYDGSRVDHQDALRQLWKLAYPERELPSLKSELWKEMGWQGTDPSTDFRGGGFISLENLIFFAKNFPESFQRLLNKQDGQRADWEYPFAIAGVNISFMLIQMLDLQSGKPSSLAGKRFLQLLTEDEMAFDNLYCVAFQMMDAQWLEKRASYMEFNDVLKSTRKQLELELAVQGITSVKDLPAYKLLKR